ncbi:MAG: hypothetical protein QME66_07210 [Candidatus Eisenbacteria bacterium]|nr:hypothetical protein [Candidatus Eisenbacteria bacterium]
MKELVCHFCGETVTFERKVMRDDECPKCGRALHSCLNCEFRSETAHNKCRESQAEWVSEKEKDNFCEYFSPGLSPKSRSGYEKEQSARRAFKDLFKDKK